VFSFAWLLVFLIVILWIRFALVSSALIVVLQLGVAVSGDGLATPFGWAGAKLRGANRQASGPRSTAVGLNGGSGPSRAALY